MKPFLPRIATRHRPALAPWVAFVLLLAAAALPAPAQDWRLAGLSGQELTPSGLAGGNAIIVTWATWSPSAKGLAARVNALEERWGSRAKVYTVNFQEDAAKVRSFVAATPFAPPVFLDEDGSFSRAYSIANLPGLLVLKDGEVAYRGKLSDNPDGVLAPLFP